MLTKIFHAFIYSWMCENKYVPDLSILSQESAIFFHAGPLSIDDKQGLAFFDTP